MMFLAMVIVFIAILLLIVGFISFILSIVFTILFTKFGKTNKICRILKKVCPFLSIGSLLLMLPFALLASYYVKKYSSIPKSYVKCDTTIQFENDFKQFKTKNGQVFIQLDYKMNYHISIDREPVYSYCPSGFFHKYEWRNVYKIDTPNEFSLYTVSYDSEGWKYGIYAKEEEYESIISYYSSNRKWGLSNGIDYASDQITTLIEKYEAKISPIEIQMNSDYFSCKFEAYSLDQLFIVDECNFFLMKNRVFIATKRHFNKYYQYFGFELFGEEKQLVGQEIDFLQN